MTPISSSYIDVSNRGEYEHSLSYQKQSILKLRNVLPNWMSFRVVVWSLCNFGSEHACIVLNMGLRDGRAAHQRFTILLSLVKIRCRGLQVFVSLRSEQLLVSRHVWLSTKNLTSEFSFPRSSKGFHGRSALSFEVPMLAAVIHQGRARGLRGMLLLVALAVPLSHGLTWVPCVRRRVGLEMRR